jgi:hypothetical protein
VVTNANAYAYCGRTDWQINAAVDIAGETCQEHPFWPIGHVLYDIYSVDGNQLHFGDHATGTGTTDGTRPIELARDYMTRE